MKSENNPIKKYELPLNDKVKIVVQNYEFGIPMIESLKNARFQTISDFADKLLFYHEKDHSEDQDFIFTIKPKSEVIEYLRKYLIKNKQFVYNYTTQQDHFINSHIYQLYLQYIPCKLTDVEKSIFLDAYINMITDLRGNSVSDEKRKKLENRLHINQD